ncbi:transcription elongation factor GreA [Cellulomonas bogoriensis]|uniref:Transcription elongation factor GreA n=1 Tax=Cellulomonas bogoriensis 69B4 = DSM 16987 TaxID=1386082 RepID=A0A0A0BSP4_9CELL|nr:transcription elongation factor GreA [Cellulomonas bogoriensis]KGM10976.1 transcription elongation factor GreA [Cellulomonas bogoriensis 69B4 = DSM 16987]
MTDTSAVTWLTQGAHDRLTAELEELTTTGRSEIAEKIEAARSEGDLKENGGYHAAREEQAKQEARIRQLQDLLRRAVVGEAPADDGVVEPGMVVTATVGGDDMTFLLGSREVAEGTDIEVFSERSPLGEAILGRSAGDTTSYAAPSGATIEVVIREAKPFQP